MLQVRAAQKLGRIESALRNAAQRRGANVLAVVNLGQLRQNGSHQGLGDGHSRKQRQFRILNPP